MKGLNRIGNLVVPNDNYCKFEDWVMPILDKMVEEQKSEVQIQTSNKQIEGYVAYSNTSINGTCSNCSLRCNTAQTQNDMLFQ